MHGEEMKRSAQEPSSKRPMRRFWVLICLHIAPSSTRFEVSSLRKKLLVIDADSGVSFLPELGINRFIEFVFRMFRGLDLEVNDDALQTPAVRSSFSLCRFCLRPVRRQYPRHGRGLIGR